MTPALPRLLLIFATLHAQTPCCLVFWSSDDECGCPASTNHSVQGAVSSAQPCSCCHGAKPTDQDPPPASVPERPPGRPAGCPADCPCMFCSPGFVPLTDFGCATLPPDTAFEPPLTPMNLSRGHAGHHQLPDRPPRLA